MPRRVGRAMSDDGQWDTATRVQIDPWMMMCVRQAISTTIFYYRALTDIYLHPPSLFIHFPLQCSSAFSLSHSPLFRFHLLSTIGAFVEHLLILSLSLFLSHVLYSQRCTTWSQVFAIEQHYQSVILVRIISNCSIISFICYYSCWCFLLLFSTELFSLFFLTRSPFLVCLSSLSLSLSLSLLYVII